jgi:hypothetical protein
MLSLSLCIYYWMTLCCLKLPQSFSFQMTQSRVFPSLRYSIFTLILSSLDSSHYCGVSPTNNPMMHPDVQALAALTEHLSLSRSVYVGVKRGE